MPKRLALKSRTSAPFVIGHHLLNVSVVFLRCLRNIDAIHSVKANIDGIGLCDCGVGVVIDARRGHYCFGQANYPLVI